MFKELAPYLRQRAVLLTVTRLEDDQISVNIIPKKLQDSENTALTTPFKLTGTAACSNGCKMRMSLPSCTALAA